MPILVKDRDMPDACGSCPCFHAETPMYCQAVIADVQKPRIVRPYAKGLPEWCPLIEIPKHGRLIDFDRIEAIMKNACDECKESSMEFDGFYADCGQCLLNGVKKDLMFAPTIIPAEEG